MSVPESKYLSPVWRDGIFKDRVVFVTGGAGTICSMQTRALVRLGADACIIGRSVEKTEAAAKDIATVRAGAKVLGIGGCDVRKAESLQVAADRCAKELGGIDFVIAGAAGNFVAPIEGLSSNAFKTVMDIDVLGTFNTVKATMPHLMRSASPRIIYVSATFHYTGMPMQAHVSAAKSAVDSLMASVALEYGPRGVTSNVIAPGGIADTEGMARLGSGDEAERAGYVKGIPSGRLGTVRDVADATVFLFSDAGSYVNGQVLAVDGAAWRRQGAISVGIDKGMEYPDYLLQGQMSQSLRDPRKAGETGKPKL
ncbi:peroxisomal 2 4-dienoyl-CoA reductase sps19 [Neonectria magnoliae]|uniref:2,4-dienoyl-CoA reductase [(3E)-enoyl-CoA-producing] n=1 Tax=Neonectria magnoliae TaxID=2732573 RepID=A0ABR1HZA9_9HYPO